MTYPDVTFDNICYAILQNKFKRSAPFDQRQVQYSTDTASCVRLQICHKNASDNRLNNDSQTDEYCGETPGTVCSKLR